MVNIDFCEVINPDTKEFPKFKPKLKLAILASGKGSNFETIINDINNRRLDAEITCLIVNTKKCGAINKALKHNIPYYILNNNDYLTREELDKAIISKLKEFNTEAIVMVGWMRIVTPVLLDEFKGKVINLHPSLLPSFKGNKAITQALNHKVKFTGCTVHLVEKEVDSGEILIQAISPIYNNDTEEMLRGRIQAQEHRIISMGIALAAIKWRGSY